MDPAEAMAALDELVIHQPNHVRYYAAKALYEASLRGLLAAPIPARTLYTWCVKYALLPGTQGQRRL